MTQVNENSSTQDLQNVISKRTPTFSLETNGLSHKIQIDFYKVKGGYVEVYNDGNPVFTSLSKKEVTDYFVNYTTEEV